MQKKSKLATTYVAKIDTMLSPKPGITPEGHCQSGMGPTPRTSQTEWKLAMQGFPWGSQRSYLKDGLARLSILILSKTYIHDLASWDLQNWEVAQQKQVH
jgi:hypothetical protein